MRDALAFMMLGSGLFFVLVGVTGILRLPDFFTRLHATSKCDTLGLALMVIGVGLLTGLTLTTFKILLIVAIVALVNSTAAHALGRAAFSSGLEPWMRKEERPR